MEASRSIQYEEIDLGTWNRTRTFEFFKDYEDPFFNMTARVDVSNLTASCREFGLSYSVAFLYCSQKALNSVKEFRIRMLDGRLVIFPIVESTQTILLEDDSFGFCYFPWREDPIEFCELGRSQVTKYKKLATFDVETDRIDLVYYSVIPWISFTSFKHASRSDREQTVPRIVFGKRFEEGGSMWMPVSVEANHMIMDGLHVGRYFERLQNELELFPGKSE